MLIGVVEKSGRAFSMSVTPWVVVPDTSKAVDKVYHASLLCLNLTGISGQFLRRISEFLANKWFFVVFYGET